MLTYNTRQKPLILPEYGRNIQKMVDHCLTITDRQERTDCAWAIITAMGNLFPELRAPENVHKLWDHLAIMADFKLDIDFPCEVVEQAELATKPLRVPYTESEFKYRHYGKLLQQMISKASAMPEGEDRDQLVRLIGGQMKKQLVNAGSDNADDERIAHDIALLSDGILRPQPQQLNLPEYKIIAPAKRKKR